MTGATKKPLQVNEYHLNDELRELDHLDENLLSMFKVKLAFTSPNEFLTVHLYNPASSG